jgi:hypothetical protein
LSQKRGDFFHNLLEKTLKVFIVNHNL